jgi:magnesium transporter
MPAISDQETSNAQHVTCAAYKQGRRMEDISLDEISDVLQQENTFIWVSMYEPDMQMLEKIQEEFGLHQQSGVAA